jgi:SAM-dependent methyltransferase
MAAPEWDERFRRGEHANDPPLKFIVEALDRIGAGGRRRALDLACGAGRHAAALASRGWDVTAVDWSAAALEMVRARDARIRTIAVDLEAGFEIERNHWDLICVSLYLQRDLFEPIREGLVAGGWVAAAFPLFDDRAGVRPMNPDYVLRPGELRSLFGDFEIQHYFETGPPPPKRRMAEFFGRKPDNRK